MTTNTATPASNLLDSLSGDEAHALRRLGDVVTVAPGTTIQPTGGTTRWFHCVLDGTVALSDGGAVETGGPGTCFPDEAIRGELTSAARSVVAVTSVTVLVLGLREFHGALDTIPGFAAALAETAPRSEQRTTPGNAARTATGGAGAPTTTPVGPRGSDGDPRCCRSRRDVGGATT